jgi:disulfide oxidoreductase YuzD
MYEAIFSAICKRPYENRNFDVNEIDATKFYNLKENPKFIDSIQSHTTNTEMVKARLNTAREALICQ